MAEASPIPDLMTVTIAELRTSLDTGSLTVRDLVQASLDQIAEVDRQGPGLRAVLEINPAALEIADALDAELADGHHRGRMHGIPVLLKDNVATTDGMENSAGSLAMLGAYPIREAFLVERLREAGAVILGKTNMSEWANLRSPRSCSGWSGRGGQTRNPHHLDRNPSGSSSGAGVAVAAGFVPVAIGTETNGSIVSPANANGVVGIKPTVGLLSRQGVIPISHHQDTAGPLARTVADAAAALTVLAGDDPTDPAVQQQIASVPSSGSSYPVRPSGTVTGIDYAGEEILREDGLQGVRIGVWRERTGYSRKADAVFEESIATLRDAGADLVDPVEVGSPLSREEELEAVEVLLWELAPGVARYIEHYVDQGFPIRSLDDVIAFNEEHADQELAWFGHEYLVRSVAKTDLSDPDYATTVMRLQRRSRELGIDAALARYGIDAIIAPSGPPATKIDLINGDNKLGGSSTLSAIAGYPIVSVPSGSRHGLPVNLSFIGGAFSEAVLIRLAYAFEHASQARIVPCMLDPMVEPPLSRETDMRGIVTKIARVSGSATT